MKTMANACRIALASATIAVGSAVVTAPPASADFNQICNTLPAMDFHMGPKKGYPPRYRFHMHLRARTLCHVTLPFTTTTSANVNVNPPINPPLNFNLGRITFSGFANAN